MATDKDGDDSDVPDPLPTPPGVTTTAFGPLGVPVPVPDIQRADGGDTEDGEGIPDDIAPSSRDESQPTESNPEMPGAEGLSDLEAAADLGNEYIDRVEAAMDDETCEMCLQILDRLRSRPIDEQVQGVRELARLKKAADRGADPGELAEIMDDFDVVSDPSLMT